MANRSYIYSYQPEGEPEYRDLGEWKSDIPISHLILVGVETHAHRSRLWNVDELIALQGNASKGLKALEGLLKWLEPQIDDALFSEDMEESLELLHREDRIGEFFHLEPGEVFDLMGYSLREMEDATSRLMERAKFFAAEAIKVAGSDTDLDDTVFAKCFDPDESHEAELGLHFPGILYFHAG